jgi:hypothetical protein
MTEKYVLYDREKIIYKNNIFFMCFHEMLSLIDDKLKNNMYNPSDNIMIAEITVSNKKYEIIKNKYCVVFNSQFNMSIKNFIILYPLDDLNIYTIFNDLMKDYYDHFYCIKSLICSIEKNMSKTFEKQPSQLYIPFDNNNIIKNSFNNMYEQPIKQEEKQTQYHNQEHTQEENQDEQEKKQIQEEEKLAREKEAKKIIEKRKEKISVYESEKDYTYKKIYDDFYVKKKFKTFEDIPMLFQQKFLIYLFMDGKDINGNDCYDRLYGRDDEYDIYETLLNMLNDDEYECENLNYKKIIEDFIEQLPSDILYSSDEIINSLNKIHVYDIFEQDITENDGNDDDNNNEDNYNDMYSMQ